MRLGCIIDMRKMHGVQCIQIVQFAICLKPNAAKRVVFKFKILTETKKKLESNTQKIAPRIRAADPGFSMRVAKSKGGGGGDANLLFRQISLKIRTTWKQECFSALCRS